MWTFCKKEKKEEPKESFDWDAWGNKWPPGKQFEYMGIKLIVVTSVEVTPYICLPIITANYVDKDGVIRSQIFRKHELDMINP